MIRIFRNFLSVLKRSREASILNIAGLSVAFAVFITILIQVDYEYSYNASFPKADQIYRLELQKEGEGEYSSLVSKPFYDIVKTEIPELSVGCIIGKAFSPVSFAIVRSDGNMAYFDELPGYADTAVVQVFDLDIMAGDYRQALGVKRNLLVPQSIAEKFFGSTDVIGKTILYEGTVEMTIAAVYRDVPSNSTFENTLYSVSFMTGQQWQQWNYDTYYVIPEKTDQNVLIEKLKGLDHVIVAQGGHEKMMENIQAWLCPLKAIYFADIRHFQEASGNKTMTNILFLIGLLVIVIATVNFVNFSTAMAPSRIKSLNTQKTFGASNRFLRWCVISEAMIFAFISFLLGLLWCHLLSYTSIQNIILTSLNPLFHFDLVIFVGGLSLIVGLLAGCYPAFYMTSFVPAIVLRGSQALSPRGVLLRNVLVVFQYTVAIVFIIGIFFVGRQLDMMKNQSWGIEKEHTVYFKSCKEICDEKRNAFMNEIQNNSAIEEMTFSSELLGNKGMQHWSFDAMVNESEMKLECDVCMIAANFLKFFDIKVTEGDTFVTSRDSVIMVNETFGKTYGFDPIGKELAGMKVGRILKDFNVFPMQVEIRPLLLAVNENWADNYYYVKINAQAKQDALVHIREVIRKFAPTYGHDVRFLDDYLNSLYQQEERLSTLVNVFGFATTLITLVGVYGLLLFNAKFKAKEIGVRKVNGATTWQMVVSLNCNFIYLVLISFVIACPVAWYGVSVWLNEFAYKTDLTAWVFGVAGCIILIITLLTISWQSLKAANANPVEVLKNE